MSLTVKKENCCPRPDLMAFIDGELSIGEEREVEKHLEDCEICSKELVDHQQFLCVLNSAFTKNEEIDLPQDFAKLVVTKAESKVSGLRKPEERRYAILISGFLIFLMTVILGGNLSTVISVLQKIAESVLTVIKVSFRFIYDFSISLTVILKTLSQHFFSSELLTLALLISLMISFLLFSKYLYHWHRA